MKKGIIFDMDGTLWDSALPVAESWNQVLEQKPEIKKRITKEDMYHVMGKTMDIIAEIFFPKMEKKKREEVLKECCIHENNYLSTHGGILYPDLEQMFIELEKEYDLYIVSNCQKGYIESFLEFYHFETYFKDIECFGNTGKKKGENIRILMERNGSFDAVYVGDIEGDYQASKEAGILFIHAAYGFGTIEDTVPAIQKPMELIDVVKSVWEKR